MQKALDYLNVLISKGIDYADACWKASQDCKVDHTALQEAYDAQFAR